VGKIAMAFAVLLLASTQANAHAGKLDANGCHHDRKAAEYHCHKHADAAYVGVTTVIDGDTIDIHGQRFRLFGIDAPESKQLCNDVAGKSYRCGQVAANILSNLIGRQTVTCEKKDVDRYKRIVAKCSVNGQDVGAYLVGKGLALAYVHYSTAYVPAETSARSAGMGLWAGTFEMPWDWRKAH
jgi:endonuclease YncB( thermonuclease family)